MPCSARRLQKIIKPLSAQACAKAYRRRPWRRRRPRRAGRKESRRRRQGRTSARRRCRCKAAIRSPARRSAARRPEWPFYRLAMLQMPIDVFDCDRRIVDQNAHCERKTAKRHHVDRLADCGQRGQRGEDGKGMEIVMISVERQLPRKRRIMRPVSIAAITPSRMTSVTADFQNSTDRPRVLYLPQAANSPRSSAAVFSRPR